MAARSSIIVGDVERPDPKKPPPPPKSSGSERRRAERHELIAQVELKRGGEVLILPVGNISAGGVLLRLDRQGGLRGLRLGEEVSVFLSVDGAGDDLAFAMSAEVMRIDLGAADRPPGVGLMWTSTDPSAVSALARVLAQVAPH